MLNFWKLFQFLKLPDCWCVPLILAYFQFWIELTLKYYELLWTCRLKNLIMIFFRSEKIRREKCFYCFLPNWCKSLNCLKFSFFKSSTCKISNCCKSFNSTKCQKSSCCMPNFWNLFQSCKLPDCCKSCDCKTKTQSETQQKLQERIQRAIDENTLFPSDEEK